MKFKQIKYSNGLSILFNVKSDERVIDYTISRLVDDELNKTSVDIYEVNGDVLKPTVYSPTGHSIKTDSFKFITDINDNLMVLSNEKINADTFPLKRMDLNTFLKGEWEKYEFKKY